MNLPQIIILALIQGMAELLPVSSSAHVIVAEKLMGMDPSSPELTFLLVMLHTGTMLAVLCYFWRRWRQRFVSSANDDPGEPPGWYLVKMIVLATACTGILGLALKMGIERVIFVKLLHQEKGEVEHLFKNLPLIGTGLFVVGILILVSGSHESKAELRTISPRSSIWIGFIQGLCLPFRGFSRSGATISTALYRGVSRSLAEDFSFALAVVLTPPVIALELYRLLKAHAFESGVSVTSLLMPGLVGMFFSFLAGLAALVFLSAILERGRWKYFGYYCMAASLVVFGVGFAGW